MTWESVWARSRLFFDSSRISVNANLGKVFMKLSCYETHVDGKSAILKTFKRCYNSLVLSKHDQISNKSIEF